MAVSTHLGDELNNTCRDQNVEVTLIGGPRASFEGRLHAAQSNYIILALGDTPEDKVFIPTSAIATVRLKKAP